MRNRTWTWPVVWAAAGLAASAAGIDAQTDRNSGSENPAVPNASDSIDAPNLSPPQPPGVPQASAGAEPKGPQLSTAEAAMLRSRSARTLLRNGTDYIKYQQFEKALTYLREAERRQKELNASEKSSLRQAIDTAQQGLRTPSLQTGYARTRRPRAGSIAIASRGTAVTKSDPAVARTEAAGPVVRPNAEFAGTPTPTADRMTPAATDESRIEPLAPLSPEILAKDLPSAADLAESPSARSALNEYHAAGLASNEPRQPVELPRPLNEKIDGLEESESQFQASESRPDPSPEAIAASLTAMRREGTPAPLPGSPALPAVESNPVPVDPKEEPAPIPAALVRAMPANEPAPPALFETPSSAEPAESRHPGDEPLSEPAPESEEPALPKFERPAAPVVATPDLPPLEPADEEPPAEPAPPAPASLPDLKAPDHEPETKPASEPAGLPALPPANLAPADLPPLPVEPEPASTNEVTKPSAEPAAKPAEFENHEMKAPPLPESPGVLTEAPVALARTAKNDAPGVPKMSAELDTKFSNAQDLTAPTAESAEASPQPEPVFATGKSDAGIEPASSIKPEAGDDPGLPPLPSTGIEPAVRSLPNSLPPLTVQPIAEAADESSDLPPLPDGVMSPEPKGRDALPPLPTATQAVASDESLPPLPNSPEAPQAVTPVADSNSDGLPPLPTAADAASADPGLPPLPTAADAPGQDRPVTESPADSLPQLPDSPPAPTPAATGGDDMPPLPELPVRTAQAATEEPRTPQPTGFDSLPPLPAEDIAGSVAAKDPVAAEVAAPLTSSFSRRYLSGLSERQRREIEELARVQQERTGGTTPGLSPLEAPAREAGDNPRVPLPAGNTSMFGAIDDPLVRLELPRAPSPAEARPIRAILLPEQFDTLKPRAFEPRRKMWASAATAHYPLYFQDPSLERYGISVEQRLGRAGRKLTYPIDDPKESKLRNQIATPFFSSGLFALQIATWPFRAIADPPWESTYDLGYYRPGDIVPEDTVVIPWKGVGPLFRGNDY